MKATKPSHWGVWKHGDTEVLEISASYANVELTFPARYIVQAYGGDCCFKIDNADSAPVVNTNHPLVDGVPILVETDEDHCELNILQQATGETGYVFATPITEPKVSE